MPRGRVADPPAPHGTRARYNHRSTPCRCAACRLANRTYMAQYRTGERPGSVSVAGAVDQPVSRRYL
ncbi:MAG TPA: hypothetical protein VJM49_13650 [Acidimicrobiales bacterium]|nr:hypothetical protein [Acidimicrobiales bacterium]